MNERAAGAPAHEAAAPSRATGPSAAPRREPIPPGVWFVIAAVALLARLVFVAATPPSVMWLDAREFEAIARSLLEHGSYGLQTARPPGYPTFIAAVYAVFGKQLLTLRIVEALLSTLATILIGLIGARAFGRTAGLISAAFAALHPVLAFLPSTQFSENLLVFMIVLALGAALEAQRRDGLWRWAVAGAGWGIALLIRPNAASMLPGLALGLALARRRAGRDWLRPALVCGATLALTLAPWIVRNHRVHGEWFFVSTGGGRQFWLGNNPRADADTRTSLWFDPEMQQIINHLPSERARERYLYGEGMKFVRANPGRAALLYLGELRNMFALYPEPYSQSRVNRWSRLAQGLASLVIFAGALLALARARREGAPWPLAGAIVTYSLVSACFFTVMRYRMAIEPCLLLLAGSGWAAAAERLQSRKR
jgi:4-amino-4-deoxy-L-arabinose transferase-like glycosyltransferase